MFALAVEELRFDRAVNPIYSIGSAQTKIGLTTHRYVNLLGGERRAEPHHLRLLVVLSS